MTERCTGRRSRGRNGVGRAAFRLLLLLLLPAPGTLPSALRAQETPPTPAEFKVFEADLGQTWIDVSTYPPEQQKAYAVFAQRCCKCHTLARPINSTLATDQWEAYVSRMSRKPGSGISPKDAETIQAFLVFDSGKRKRTGGVDPELLPFFRVSREISGVERFPASLRDIRPGEDGLLRVGVEADPRADLSRFLAADAGQKLVKWSRRAPHQGEVILSEVILPGKPGREASAASSGAAIADAVDEAVGDEEEVRERVELLLDWLDEEIAHEARDGAADAAAVLADRRGDATEFTALFVAMANAAGVPARPRVGFVARRTAFYAHPWAEVWIDGWIGVDPYLGQFPADLTHLRVQEAGGEGSGKWDANRIPGIDKLQLRVSVPEDEAPPAGG